MSEYEQIIQMAKVYSSQDVIEELERKYANNNQKGRIFIQIGNVLFDNSYYTLALNLWERTLNYLADTDNDGKATCYLNIASGYVSTSNFAKALTNFEKALTIAKAVHNPKTELDSYNGLGVTYHKLRYFGLASEKYEESLKMAVNLGDLSGQANCYIN